MNSEDVAQHIDAAHYPSPHRNSAYDLEAVNKDVPTPAIPVYATCLPVLVCKLAFKKNVMVCA